MKYFYQIADLNVQLNTPFEIKIGEESKEFIFHESEDVIDDQIDFCPMPSLEYTEENGHWEALRLYTKDYVNDSVYHCIAQHREAYACMRWQLDTEQNGVCEYAENLVKNVYSSHSISNIIGIETLLYRHQGLLLHASFIRWNGMGILFSAPSGTGKSTQADLWAKYENAEILNGDRAAIRKIGATWYAYGLPYAGSSGIYRNEKAPVNAIIILKQALTNTIRKVSITEAVTFLYPEFTIHRWDNEFSEKTLDLILKLLSEIPVYLLECTPDIDAVKAVKNICF